MRISTGRCNTSEHAVACGVKVRSNNGLGGLTAKPADGCPRLSMCPCVYHLALAVGKVLDNEKPVRTQMESVGRHADTLVHWLVRRHACMASCNMRLVKGNRLLRCCRGALHGGNGRLHEESRFGLF